MKSCDLKGPQIIAQYAVESLAAQSKALSLLATRIDGKFVDVVNLLLECAGRIVICGMGKSGLVGKKIAATLASTGTPSFFMHPGEALHGDLGMIRNDDVVVLISNSGETEEILRLLPALLHFDNRIVAMVGRADSTLAQAAHFVLDVSVEREVCPLNLAPTTSTVATMAMGDALAVALMQVRDFQPHDFARFHPGGNLGRRLLTRVKDVMHHDVPLVSLNTPLQETMLRMTAGRLGLAVVINEVGNLCGLFTDGDLRRALSRAGASMSDAVDQHMTHGPITIDADSMLVEAEEIMLEKKIRCLIVTANREDRPIGIVEIFDR
jgi:arabinose-5-phosphate isomerase